MVATAVVDGSLIRLSGRLDGSGAAEARAALHDALAVGSGDLVVDLSEVDVIDATGLGVVVGAHRRGTSCGRRIVLRGVSDRFARILRVTRLDRVLVLEH